MEMIFKTQTHRNAIIEIIYSYSFRAAESWNHRYLLLLW